MELNVIVSSLVVSEEDVQVAQAVSAALANIAACNLVMNMSTAD